MFGTIQVYPIVTGLERQTLWDKGYLLGMTTIRGTVFHNPGIGRATSGHSILVTKQVNEIFRWLWKITEQINLYYDKILRYIGADILTGRLHLRIGKNSIEIYEKSSGITVLTYNDVIDETLFLPGEISN
ncbi:hypothetical protein [Mucilaginibacter sp. FT3.2]|uniref:hypothetical protein n=1 Tax=Mucilaginibacter sp. FT3.2 TaxID=2723090 RepID=UPI001615BE1D|nr:hypothetical protein [Mucilaginibacter sp. FT3.2]MBB6233624.1 hypothetical protein [Mucilaginibacter sp. FT3.2]